MAKLYYYCAVPAIYIGPVNVTVEYSDDLTAIFTCNAFGGVGAALKFMWETDSPAGLNENSQRQYALPADDSTTSEIATNILSLEDRDGSFRCKVRYDDPSDTTFEESEEAYLSIGKYK